MIFNDAEHAKGPRGLNIRGELRHSADHEDQEERANLESAI
jgi:hypothetical protein